ncbi:MAG: DUF2190 family protein [Arenimonas sp.]
MAKNYVQEGDVINHTNASGSTITSGSGVLVGSWLGVALADIPSGATGSVQISYVFTLPKLSTDAVAQGVSLYWDNTNKRLTTSASGNTLAGRAAAAAAAGVATVQIKLNA